MNNEVTYKVNTSFINKTNCDYVSNNRKISNDSDQIIDNYEDSELITDSESSDLSLPINNIGRMMKLSIPGSAKISRESKMLMQQISKDFIVCISSQAGVICTSNKRRVLNGEDIINALSSFGFGDYTNTLIDYLNIWRGLKQSRSIKSYSNIYRSNISSLNFNENYQIPIENSKPQFHGVDQKFENNYVNESLINDHKPINNECNKYLIQNNSSTDNQQTIYTNLPKCMNNAIYECVNLNIDKNINSHKYPESTIGDTNAHYGTNKSHFNTLLLSPTRSINFLNESSPDTPKSSFPLNQCGKRKRTEQEESKVENVVDSIERNIDFNAKYNMNYNIKNSTDVGLIENNAFQGNKKSTINFSRYCNNLEYSYNQYKQDEIFLNKNETAFDCYFSSDLYIQEESENDSEYNAYPSGLFIS
ncbi:Histone-like transcription factor (CBF/NF-Y) and archaeal histone family protein [Cryptosporidium meleagridis]|uniref:Histone-like transcription factor (CBF/NF-Y) and archaeal histone family protein n=1 Tax=Cryptosporidium meleagridis TaxID=93969 RepID=A0A2P4YXE8_9CRYT|nr:Histone-like transcription factor (CBF/NF-Y) and archaeal histone family protein [Cryptosporidium meleagridis]